MGSYVLGFVGQRIERSACFARWEKVMIRMLVLFAVFALIGIEGLVARAQDTEAPTLQSQVAQESPGQDDSAEDVAEGDDVIGPDGAGRFKVPESVPNEVMALSDGETKTANRLVRLSRKDAVWIDKATQTVVVAGSVCNRKGPLEMFACPRGTKDYESVIAVDSRSQIVHAALLAVGIESGSPVEFAPKYLAAHGPTIEITLVWTDPDSGKKSRAPAQRWIRNTKTNKAMTLDWVFAGSRFWTDPDTSEEIYLAEGGELVCVSNFATATLDLPVASPQDNADLWYEAYTKRIPEVGTRVWLLMREKNGAKGPELE